MTHKITVVARRLVIDRTFRFYAPRTDFLRETVKLDALPGRGHSFYTPGVDLRQLEAVSSHRHVVLQTKGSAAGQAAHERVVIRAKSAARAAQSETFYVTLYTDARQAVPTETWQVRAHVLTNTSSTQMSPPRSARSPQSASGAAMLVGRATNAANGGRWHRRHTT